MKIKLLFVLVFFTGIVAAQQDAQFTQYMYNTININPAYAGSRDALNVMLLHRTQWVGLDGAPTTNTLSVNTPINNSNLGLGVSVVNDKIGPSDENNLALDLSYTIHTSERYKLSLGLKATANLLNIDYTKLNKYDQNDYSFQTNIDNKFSPNLGVGFYLHSDNTYIGLSAPNLFETVHFDRYSSTGANTHITEQKIHYYLIAGHVFDINPTLKFKPSLLTKMVHGAPLQVDVSGNFLINDKFMAGVAYRWSAAMSAMVGFQVSEKLFIGYGYDLETTRLENYNSGSHEIFIRFELFNRYDRIISPRFF